MKRLGYDWKVVTPFHVRVRRVNPITKHVNKMSLQVRVFPAAPMQTFDCANLRRSAYYSDFVTQA